MYIAVYPIAMSIRSTNVYEERSLGIFVGSDDESVSEGHRRTSDETLDRRDVEVLMKETSAWWAGPRSYLSVHARKQLAFDIW